MVMNHLVRECVNDQGKKVYRIATYDIDVVAKASTGGLAPTIIYLHDNEDITDSIRQIRFDVRSPYSYIEDYDRFQSMLYQKEQEAITELYDSFSIRPKNMPAKMQVLWHFGVLLLMTIPLLVAMIFLN